MALAGEIALLAMALIGIAAIASAGYAISTVYLVGRLQTHHRQAYADLGNPDVYVPKWYDWMKLIPFIWRRDYLAISDSVVIRWGAWARVALLVSTSALVLFVLVIAAFAE